MKKSYENAEMTFVEAREVIVTSPRPAPGGPISDGFDSSTPSLAMY